ncbi:MAG: hypothetical protein Q9163_001369 [Psora crenata]
MPSNPRSGLSHAKRGCYGPGQNPLMIMYRNGWKSQIRPPQEPLALQFMNNPGRSLCLDDLIDPLPSLIFELSRERRMQAVHCIYPRHPGHFLREPDLRLAVNGYVHAISPLLAKQGVSR